MTPYCQPLSKKFLIYEYEAENMEDRKPLTEARKKSIKKYLSQFADFKVHIPKEQLDEVHNHAAQMGESTAAFMRRAIAETMERDKHSEK